MCTSPIQVSRRNPLTGQTRVDVVPCGKCEECRSFKRQEFAALSIHQAMVSGSLYFFTLTYNDEHLPIAVSDSSSSTPTILGFELICDFVSTYYDNGHFRNRVSDIGDSLHWVCSLRREDVRNWIKQFRVEYERKFKEKPSFKYCFFGELGEHHGRPHYHGLVYGCTPAAAKMLHDLWCVRFGFAYCVPSDYRNLDLNEIGKVSNYVSKYISKGVSSRFAHLLPYIEKPRRICSQDFGSFSLDEYKRLRDYYDGADLHHLSKDLFLEEVSKRRTSLKLNGNSFPIPLRLKQKLFYENGSSNFSGVGESNSGKGILPCKVTKSPVSCMVSRFKRSQYYSVLDNELRQDSVKNSFEVSRWVVRKARLDEESSARSREEIAQKNHITHLKQQKDDQ